MEMVRNGPSEMVHLKCFYSAVLAIETGLQTEEHKSQVRMKCASVPIVCETCIVLNRICFVQKTEILSSA